MFKYVLILCSWLLITSLPAQQVLTRDLVYNRIAFRLNTEGSYFENRDGKPAYRIPPEAYSSTLYTANLWFGSILASGDTATVVGTYTDEGVEMLPGPISSNTDADYFDRYLKTWVLSADQLLYHKLHYQDAGYAMIPEIRDWPANGRPGIDTGSLAPYNDVDQNGIYNPGNGDYPLIPGDMNVFYMKNSANGQVANTTGGKKLKLQVSGFLYAFHATEAPFHSTLFHKIIVTNGSVAYDKLLMGMWIDLDIGDHFDDYAGTLVDQNTVYAYNSDNSDTGGKFPFGDNPPVQGFTWLNRPLYSSTVYGYPDEPDGHYREYYYYLAGKHFDGSYRERLFDFPGDPLTNDSLSEPGQGIAPGDRRVLSVVNLGNIAAGETVCIDAALITTRTGNTNLENLANFPADVRAVQDFYDSILAGECFRYAASVDESGREPAFTVYPNPATDRIFLQHIPVQAKTLEVANSLGQLVLSSYTVAVLPVGQLSPGIYVISVKDGYGRVICSQRLVK
ncbi:MAG: T9SS type A sorting domain-containing protein [Bacteroidota bacterium]